MDKICAIRCFVAEYLGPIVVENGQDTNYSTTPITFAYCTDSVIGVTPTYGIRDLES